MRRRDRESAAKLDAELQFYDRERRALPGIRCSARRTAFLEQMIESIRRVRHIHVIRSQKLSERRGLPNDELFDPLKAAILQQRQGDVEEAFWLVFFFVHFGKHARAGWRYAREIYGRLGEGGKWNWESTSLDPSGFRVWLDSHKAQLRRQGAPHGFGNHRKRESLDAYSPNGTGTVVESYVNWVNPPRTHHELMEQAVNQAAGDARRAFDLLYHSMDAVVRFGRLARFDYLTMVGKLDLAPIAPGSAYMQGATGPVRGARMLFGRDESTATLDYWLAELDAELNVGMQVLEDALCNWQKSPDAFRPFRG